MGQRSAAGAKLPGAPQTPPRIPRQPGIRDRRLLLTKGMSAWFVETIGRPHAWASIKMVGAPPSVSPSGAVLTRHGEHMGLVHLFDDGRARPIAQEPGNIGDVEPFRQLAHLLFLVTASNDSQLHTPPAGSGHTLAPKGERQAPSSE